MSRMVIHALVAIAVGGFSLSASAAQMSARQVGQHWTIKDIVEVKRIVGTAVRGSSRVAAFILKEPSLSDGRNHYELFQISPGKPARHLLAAAYMADLAWRPNSSNWTLRADLGQGVQLYQVDQFGRVTPILINSRVALIGGYALQIDSTEGPRPTGVISYQWSPDGRKFWYSCIRFKTPIGIGVVYDDKSMSGAGDRDLTRALRLAGTELHVVNAETGYDRQVAFSPADIADFDRFRYSYGSALWAGSSALQYRLRETVAGHLAYSLWRLDLKSWKTTRLPVRNANELYYSIPTSGGIETVRKMGTANHLVELSLDGRIARDYGIVDFKHIGGGLGWWTDERRRQWIFEAHYADRDGLVLFPSTKVAHHFQKLRESLNTCAFNRTLTFGVCNRESLARAPELVSVSPANGLISVISRPNARYDRISPLRTDATEWTNRYGSASSGYVTYPRNYKPGRKYPVLLVTHGSDARNLFAYDGFQWEFPIQVFAEEGYFVLSVNEPSRRAGEPLPPYFAGATKSTVDKLQFSQSLNPMASMEAAAESMIRDGKGDSSEIGIAGYSHGAETTGFTVSHSTLFGAAIIADDSTWSAGGYWSGSELARRTYDNFFGGAPFDSQAFANYKRYSITARADRVNGPVLQQFSSGAAPGALELNELLKHAGIPTELVIYPGESHIFYLPRDRAAAMQRSLDWFNYWLLGKRDPDPLDKHQYSRWDNMARDWKACADVCRSKLGVANSTN